MSDIAPGSGVPSDIPTSFLSEVGKLTIPLFVGAVMNWALLGTLAVQMYIHIYYLAFPKDRLSSKAVVAFVVVAEIVQTLGCSQDSIRIFGAGRGNPQVLEDIGWEWFNVPILSSLSKQFTSLFRISSDAGPRWLLIQSRVWVPIIIAVACSQLQQATTVQLGAGIWTTADMHRREDFSEDQLIKPPAEAWLAATAAFDLIIVAGMVFHLLKAREPEFTRRIKATLSRIIKASVFCAVTALVVLTLFVALNGNNYHLGVCIWLSKVYSNSMMIILNSRAHIGHDPIAPSATKMVDMTGVVFNSSVGPTSTMQSSRQERNIAAEDGPSGGVLESKRDVAKRYWEVVVSHSSVGIQGEICALSPGVQPTKMRDQRTFGASKRGGIAAFISRVKTGAHETHSLQTNT
ncbi:hypothetical protein C8R45DRAFT_927833 [Mycena sanguinolenta]|nr:hypothetical protein C8R45DRAFT_927833 [Mycena sanguinolenta]